MNAAVVGVTIVGLAACGGGGDAGTDTGGAAAGGGDAGAAMTVTDPGTINGMIAFTGTAPENPTIDMSAEPVCADKHAEQPRQQQVVVNNGGLKNVFVYISDGLTGDYGASDAPTMDQDGCEYIPRVIGVTAGTPVTFQNSDGLLHNIKSTPANNPTFNVSQPTSMSAQRTFNAAEIMIPVQCDVHGWMHAYIGVVEHPYFAVSGDDGSFSIGNLPAGTYTLTAWHEQYGEMTQQITIAANATQDVTFTYDAAAQANAVVPMGDPIDPHDHHGTPGDHQVPAPGTH